MSRIAQQATEHCCMDGLDVAELMRCWEVARPQQKRRDWVYLVHRRASACPLLPVAMMDSERPPLGGTDLPVDPGVSSAHDDWRVEPRSSGGSFTGHYYGTVFFDWSAAKKFSE